MFFSTVNNYNSFTSQKISNLSYKMPMKEKKRRKKKIKASFWWKWSVYIVLDAFHRSDSTCLNFSLKCSFHSSGVCFVWVFLIPSSAFLRYIIHAKISMGQVWVFFFPRNLKVFLQTSSEWNFVSTYTSTDNFLWQNNNSIPTF